jgi:hypothetical protein
MVKGKTYILIIRRTAAQFRMMKKQSNIIEKVCFSRGYTLLELWIELMRSWIKKTSKILMS